MTTYLVQSLVKPQVEGGREGGGMETGRHPAPCPGPRRQVWSGLSKATSLLRRGAGSQPGLFPNVDAAPGAERVCGTLFPEAGGTYVATAGG